MPPRKQVTDKSGNVPAKNRTKNVGRRWVPTQKLLREIEEMIMNGRSMREVVAHCGVTQKTFYTRMKATDDPIIDENGQNKIQAAVEFARKSLADDIENTILAKALDPKHREHFKAATWYLEKVLYQKEQEPQIVVIQQGNNQPDPKEISAALREARRKDIRTTDKNNNNDSDD